MSNLMSASACIKITGWPKWQSKYWHSRPLREGAHTATLFVDKLTTRQPLDGPYLMFEFLKRLLGIRDLTENGGEIGSVLGGVSSNLPRKTHDFGGAIGAVPILENPHIVRLHVTTSGQITLDDSPVCLDDLAESLRAIRRVNTVVHYSRDNPEEDNDVVASVIDCVARVALPIALPPEATETLNRSYRKDDSS